MSSISFGFDLGRGPGLPGSRVNYNDFCIGHRTEPSRGESFWIHDRFAMYKNENKLA